MRSRLPIAVSLLLATAVASAPAAAEVERRHAVGGAVVEDVDQEDGGTLVRLRRNGRGYRFEYYLEFWRGNGGVVVGANFGRGECLSGESSSIVPTENAMTRASLDLRLDDYLRECPLAPAREAALRRSLDAAWPTFSAWAQQALAAVEAENQAIADYGREP